MNLHNLIPWHRNARGTFSTIPARRDPLQSLHDQVDRLFDEAFRLGTTGQLWFGSEFDTWPKIDITDEEAAVRIVADLPGMEQKDIDLSINDGVLTLKGEKTAETENKDSKLAERFYGRFERQIPIGYDLDEDKVDAHFENGVLKITLPKSEGSRSRPKSILIRS
ncbi:Hsp20/alpha crystallin family protein [Brucella tritici]|uniref:Hsp20/alpha crystallin family protein n=1 Tax=Brucella tritici TaxID=94626 RepID=UPI0015903978|nr:Hsp20/alpha crystallin family protein [Brucella tritici]